MDIKLRQIIRKIDYSSIASKDHYFTWSFITYIIAFILMVSAKFINVNTSFPPELRNTFVNSATDFFDPSAIQGVTLIVVCLIIWLNHRPKQPSSKTPPLSAKLILLLITPILLMVLLYLMEQAWLKPAFEYPRPDLAAEPLGDPWLTNFVIDIIKRVITSAALELSPYQDIPSGFIMRQSLLTYLGIWFIHKLDLSRASTQKWCRLILVISFLWVVFSRVYRANHTWLSAIVAVSFITAFFWTFLFFIQVLTSSNSPNYKPTIGLIIANLIMFLMLISFANGSRVSLIVLCVVLLSIIPIAQLIKLILSSNAVVGVSDP